MSGWMGGREGRREEGRVSEWVSGWVRRKEGGNEGGRESEWMGEWMDGRKREREGGKVGEWDPTCFPTKYIFMGSTVAIR